jgi:hypothetical protein
MSAVCPEGMSSALLESRAGAAECAGLICRNGGSAIFIGNGGDGGDGTGTPRLGAAWENRTPDLFITSELLYRLS